jgi:hypothetical protein
MVDRMKDRDLDRPRVDLHIGELIVDGFLPDRANAIGGTLQRGLTRRLEIEAGSIDLTNGAAVATLVQDTLAELVRKGGA